MSCSGNGPSNSYTWGRKKILKLKRCIRSTEGFKLTSEVLLVHAVHSVVGTGERQEPFEYVAAPPGLSLVLRLRTIGPIQDQFRIDLFDTYLWEPQNMKAHSCLL